MNHPPEPAGPEDAGPVDVRLRHFQHRRILRLDRNVYRAGVERLAEAAVELGEVSAVIGVANGGLTPARDLAELLGAPAYHVDAKHNPTDNAFTQATGRVSFDLRPLGAALDGTRPAGAVLVVDDICGSGTTLATVVPAISTFTCPDAKVWTVALCRNAGSALNPDLWIWTVDDWVSFPWEAPPQAGTAVEDLTMPDQVRTA